MTSGDSSSEWVLSLAHVFALVFGEDFQDYKVALTLLYINADLEICTWFHRLTVEIPRQSRGGRTAEEYAEHCSVAIVDSHVMKWQHEVRRLFRGPAIPRLLQLNCDVFLSSGDDCAGLHQGSWRHRLQLLSRRLGDSLCGLSGYDTIYYCLWLSGRLSRCLSWYSFCISLCYNTQMQSVTKSQLEM